MQDAFLLADVGTTSEEMVYCLLDLRRELADGACAERGEPAVVGAVWRCAELEEPFD